MNQSRARPRVANPAAGADSLSRKVNQKPLPCLLPKVASLSCHTAPNSLGVGRALDSSVSGPASGWDVLQTVPWVVRPWSVMNCGLFCGWSATHPHSHYLVCTKRQWPITSQAFLHPIICICAKYLQLFLVPLHMRSRLCPTSISVPSPPTARSRLATLTETGQTELWMPGNKHGPAGWSPGETLIKRLVEKTKGATQALRVKCQHIQLL